MLDVGFSEILLTSAIALIVLGPERLPKVARQVGNWMGRARAMARQLSEQLEREVSAEELLKIQTQQNLPASRTAAATVSPAAQDVSPAPQAVTPPVAGSPAGAETTPVIAPLRSSTPPPTVPHPTSAAAMHAADAPPQAELPLSDPHSSATESGAPADPIPSRHE